MTKVITSDASVSKGASIQKKIEFQNFALQNFPVLSNKASQHISHSSLAESRKEIPFTETTSCKRNWGVTVTE
jgi:hypothetical protein